MAHFVEQYIHAIQTSDDYDMLTHQIEIGISKNILNHISTDIKEAIDRLNVDTPFYDFIKMMVWASTVSDHTETSLNLLKYFCNKVASQFDSLSFELDEYSLMVITICADDKSFISKITEDRKIELANTLCRWYLVKTERDNESHVVDGLFHQSIDLILQGYNIDQLDRYFEGKYKDICSEYKDYGDHVVNEIVRPLQALFINIIQNIDQEELLFQLSTEEWINRVDAIITEKSDLYATKGSSKDPKEYKLILHDLIFTFDDFNKDFSAMGYTGFNNPSVGKFIWFFLEDLHQQYNRDNVTLDEIKFLVREAQRIFLDNFSVSEECRTVLNTVINTYCDSPSHEDSLMQDQYLEAIKMYLKQDSMFMTWYGDYKDNNKEALFDRVISTYINDYMNPNFTIIDNLIQASEAAVMEAKSEQWDPDENNDEDSSNTEEEYTGPEIDAKQSSKSYNKGSKMQADAERKIYKGYKNYKNNEAKVDSQLSKMLTSAKKAFAQDKTEEIIEGKRFTPIGLLKKVLITAAIFNYSKVAGFVYLVVSHTLSKKRTEKQKNEILIEIDTEIKMLDEKIEDARGDGNRQAKYALMRTRSELIRARDKIKYNLTATKQDMKTAKSYVRSKHKYGE